MCALLSFLWLAACPRETPTDHSPPTGGSSETTGSTGSTGHTGGTTPEPELRIIRESFGGARLGASLASAGGLLAAGGPSIRLAQQNVAGSVVLLLAPAEEGAWPLDGTLSGPDVSDDFVWQFADGAALVAPGDVTGDGIEDLAMFGLAADVTDFGAGGYLFAGPLPGTHHHFDDPGVVGLGAALRGTRCGDVDADGTDDLCLDTGVHLGPVGATADLSFWGDGVPRPEVRLVSADLDDDGRPQLVLWEPGVALWRIDTFPTGTHAPSTLAGASWTVPAGAGVDALAAGADLDGDGLQDLVVGWRDADGPRVSIVTDAGGSALVDAWATIPVAGVALALGDLTGDGVADLAVGGDGSVRVFVGPIGAGPIAPETAVRHWVGPSPVPDFGVSLLLADLGGDGQDGLYIGSPGDPGPYTPGTGSYYSEGRIYEVRGPLAAVEP